MDGALAWLALEVKDLEAARSFYGDVLGLPAVAPENPDTDVAFAAGGSTLVCRRPTGVPRGGLHTHFAFSAPDGYDRLYDRLAAEYDLVEHTFGSSRSLYLYDPAGNCVEIGEAEPATPPDAAGSSGPITGIFEVVLEVADLEAAVDRFTALGFAVSDPGGDRRRVRLHGPVDLELWEPQLGIADARGGVHVDLGFAVPDPDAAVEPIRDVARGIEAVGDGCRVLDPDGHYLTFVPS